MLVLIRACFAFWYGTILSYSFAGIKRSRGTILKMTLFFVIAILLQIWTDSIGGSITAERLYPLTTHLPLVLWMILLHDVKWEVSIGSVITAYLCCELPNWVSQFGAIPFGSNDTVEVVIYCISSVTILLVLLRYLSPAIRALFMKSRVICIRYTIIPFLYYIWCYSTTVYSSYLKQYGYEVAFTMAALCTLLFLVFSVSQNKRQEDEEIMKELEKAKQDAIRANRAKGDFLASMSHEIRTPINAVLGLDEMILRECKDPQILDYAEKIKSSGQSLLYLINDILDLSKIESNKMELELAEYSPKQLFSEVLLMIEPRANTKKLALTCVIDPQIPSKLYGDDIRIRQVLINLLTNAVKYTEKGKIIFSVQVIEKAGEKVKLSFSVRDTGIGIKEEDRKKLFESFQRVDTAKNKKIEGTGLGLSITRRLLKLMDSDLELQSIYQVGSDFGFELQQKIIDEQEMGVFQKGEHLPAATDTYQESFCAPDVKVLVVDDIEINLVVFCGLLKNSGMKIQTASSGMQALEAIYNESFDLVFLDHLMPDMDGIETLHQIVGDELLRGHAPTVIALTANAISGARELYLNEGFSGYLTKPVQGPELEKLILELLPPGKVQRSVQSVPAAEKENVIMFDVTAGTEENTQNALTEATLDQQVGLAYCAGNRVMYLEVLKAFVQSEFAPVLTKYFEEKDWNNYQISIHGAKSGAKSIGAMALSELARDMESALKERNDIDYIMLRHPDVLDEIGKVEQLIREILTK